MELSPTAYVILGMLSWRPMSGYDIKAVVDRSTRFFWAASYGQIYPELRRLADSGLIDGEPRPQGGRRRTVYKLTSSGRRRLREWLRAEPETFELRDEGLLKLFFASAAPESAVDALAAKRRYHLDKLEQLREIERAGTASGFAHTVLRYGIEQSEWTARWCERAIAELEQGGAVDREEVA
jgi:PadR family transcriptional regulator, regulatory protein AphA